MNAYALCFQNIVHLGGKKVDEAMTHFEAEYQYPNTVNSNIYKLILKFIYKTIYAIQLSVEPKYSHEL